MRINCNNIGAMKVWKNTCLLGSRAYMHVEGQEEREDKGIKGCHIPVFHGGRRLMKCPSEKMQISSHNPFRDTE